MLRITVLCQTATQTVLRLEGELARDAVRLLGEQVAGHLRGSSQVVLDLDGVTYVDPAGTELLVGGPAARCALRGGSMYVRTLLAARGPGAWD